MRLLSIRRLIRQWRLGWLAAGTAVVGSSCSPDHDADNRWLAAEAAASFAKTLRSVGLEAVHEGATITVAGKRIEILATVEAKQNAGAKEVLAAAFDVAFGGTRDPALRSGSVGLDDTAELARTTAVSEWAALSGTPIAFALATRLGAENIPAGAKVELEGLTLFHGAVGIRGTVKDDYPRWSADLVTKLANSALPLLQRTAARGNFRAVSIQVAVRDTMVTGGECRIDGAVSRELLDAVSSLQFPRASPDYLLKLFFVSPVGDR